MTENIMRKLFFENGQFFTAAETLIVEIALYGGIVGPIRWAEGGNGLLGPQGCHLSENNMRKVFFENGKFFTAAETLIVEITLDE